MAVYGAGVFERGIRALEYLGLSDVILPFLLIFTIIYAILQRTELLGKERKNFNIMVALIMALGVVIPHVTGTYPARADVVDIINRALPNVSIIIVAVLMVLLLMGVFGVEFAWVGTSATGIIAIVAFILVVYVFGAAADLWGRVRWLYWVHDPDVQALLIIIIVFGLVAWFITSEPKETKGEGMLKSIGDLFKKKE
jgi:hypothetical protein